MLLVATSASEQSFAEGEEMIVMAKYCRNAPKQNCLLDSSGDGSRPEAQSRV
jgi:hypothetical protein